MCANEMQHDDSTAARRLGHPALALVRAGSSEVAVRASRSTLVAFAFAADASTGL